MGQGNNQRSDSRRERCNLQYLQTSVGHVAYLPGVEDLPGLQVKGLVQPPCGFRRGHVDEPVSYVALVA